MLCAAIRLTFTIDPQQYLSVHLCFDEVAIVYVLASAPNCVVLSELNLVLSDKLGVLASYDLDVD